MTDTDRVRSGDFGYPIVPIFVDAAGVAVSIADATSMYVILVPPERDAIVKPAEFVTNGTDGKITYTVTTGIVAATTLDEDDPDSHEQWIVQGLALGTTFKVHSAEFTFDVYRSLGEAPA